MRANGEDPEGVDARVRRRLRELRAEQGLTLAQVAERATLDVSTLSRLEAGKRRLALDHLPALAAALGVSTDDLLGTGPARDPRVRGEPRICPGMTMWPLSERGNAGSHAYEVHISAERSVPPDEWHIHAGHDWLYVLEGRLRLVLGAQDLIIGPGEAAEFTTITPHWFGAVDGPVKLLLIVDAQGERIHLRD